MHLRQISEGLIFVHDGRTGISSEMTGKLCFARLTNFKQAQAWTKLGFDDADKSFRRKYQSLKKKAAALQKILDAYQLLLTNGKHDDHERWVEGMDWCEVEKRRRLHPDD